MTKSFMVRKFRNTMAALTFVAPLLFVTVPDAWASTFTVPELDELVTMSSAVVQGVVVSRECRRIAGGRIVTDYTVVVSDVAAGSLPAGAESTVTFTFPGGTVGDVGELVTGVPVFAPGNEVVLFLKRPQVVHGQLPPPALMVVTGMAVGALKIERAPGGAATVHGLAAAAYNRAALPATGSGGSPAGRTALPRTAVPAPSPPETAPLPQFLDAVRDAAASNGGGK